MRRIAAIIALLVGATASFADVPVIATRFTITGRAFTAGMGAGRVPAEREVGAAIARLVQEKYPFFNWREESEAASPAAKFIVTLREEPVDDTRSAFYLDYQRQLGGKWRPEALKLGADRELYSAGKRSKPYSDRATLSTDVVRRLTEQLDNIHKSEFETGFISKVPLCACAAVVANGHTIVLQGFAWADLKASRGSWLNVDVEVRKEPSDGIEFIPKGWIRLTDLEPAATWIGGHLGRIHCANADLDRWEQESIMDALHQKRGPKFFVYVTQYDYDNSVQPEQNPDL
jgi:hypothetical protein